MIVGVDAGTTTAVAFVTLDGEVAGVESHKHWNARDVIARVSAAGPEVVACDTAKPSGLAKQVATAFSARLVLPHHSLHIIDKERMTAGKVRNKHERDALAAALKAYHLLQNKLRQAGAKAKAKDKRASVQRLVMRGVKMSEAVARSG